MIDQTVIAQVITTAVAFLIFFFLAKKLFWNSILNLIDERQARIKGEFDKIDTMQTQVNSLQADYTRRIAEIEAEARHKMQEAIAQGRKISEEIQQQARDHTESEMQRIKQSMQVEMEKARAELKEEVVRMTVAATEKIIRQQMNEAGQRRQVEQFVEELSRK